MGTRSTILCHHGLATAGLTPLCAVKFSTLYCTQMCWFLVCPSAKATGQVRQRGLIHKKKDASARPAGVPRGATHCMAVYCMAICMATRKLHGHFKDAAPA